MTSALERMARALCRQDSPGAADSYVDRYWGGYVPEAKAALAALLPLDDDGVDVARKATMKAGQSGHLSATPITDVVARAALAAYLRHIQEGT